MVRTDGEPATVTVDLAYARNEFADHLSALIHTSGPEKGFPLSYADFVLGMRYIQRKVAREKLRMADSFMVTQAADPQQRINWQREQQILGGLD